MNPTIHFWIVLITSLVLLCLMVVYVITQISIFPIIIIGAGILTLIYITVLAIKDMFFTKK